MKNDKDKLIYRTEQFADEYRMLDCTDIAVGFSGGSDSSLLLFILNEISKKRNFRLHAVHINHMIRGAEADRDEEFCRRTAQSYGIPFHSLKADIPAISREKGQSEELCAREVRYGFFNKIKAETEAEGKKVYIATAHNQTDNAETVLFNLARGSSLLGACGIPPLRDGHIIRPLLFLSKDEIENYCKVLGIEYVVDSTNKTALYTRNKIRHGVIGTLREINPSLENAIFRASAALRADAEFIDNVAKEAYARAGDKTALLREALLGMPDALLSRVLCFFIEENGASCENSHIRLSMKKIAEGKDFYVSLIGKKRLVLENGKVLIEADTREKKEAFEWEMPLCEGENRLPDGSFVYLFLKKDEIERLKTQNVYKLFIKQTLSGDTIDGVYFARSRKEGDTVKSGGHTHKVKKLLSDKKIPPQERNFVPMILRAEEIVWIPEVRARDGEGTDGQIYAAYAKIQTEDTDCDG